MYWRATFNECSRINCLEILKWKLDRITGWQIIFKKLQMWLAYSGIFLMLSPLFFLYMIYTGWEEEVIFLISKVWYIKQNNSIISTAILPLFLCGWNVPIFFLDLRASQKIPHRSHLSICTRNPSCPLTSSWPFTFTISPPFTVWHQTLQGCALKAGKQSQLEEKDQATQMFIGECDHFCDLQVWFLR